MQPDFPGLGSQRWDEIPVSCPLVPEFSAAGRARFAKAEVAGLDSRGWGCETVFAHQPRFETEILTTRENLKAMRDVPGKSIDRVRQRASLDKLILALNSSARQTRG